MSAEQASSAGDTNLAAATEHMVVAVTGGSRGIGRAIVVQLARAGMEVYFTYLNNEAASADLVKELRDGGHLAHAIRVDARDAAASASMVDRIVGERGRLDALVNNAGITADRLLALMSQDEWSSVLDTSLNGLFGATRRAAKQMMSQKRGRIINLTSVSGVIGIPGQTNYSAAKAAIIGFTRSLAKEVAPWGVCVNAVAPGFVETDMIAGFTPAQRSAALARVPMRRFAAADEIAGLVGFLAREAPTYITGQTIVIDGGLAS